MTRESYPSTQVGTIVATASIALVTIIAILLIVLGTATQVNYYNAQSESIEADIANAQAAPEDVAEPEAPVAEPEPEPEAPVEPAPEPAPVEPAPPPAPSYIVPGCYDLYSAGMLRDLDDAGLLPVQAGVVNSPPGTADPVLHDILVASADRLECSWHPANGGIKGIETTVVKVSGSTGHDVRARLQDLGFTAKDELGGTRYFFEGKNENGTKVGESHIVVDGYWFATRWIKYGPKGYTADMVEETLG